jgi:hypothetical protein
MNSRTAEDQLAKPTRERPDADELPALGVDPGRVA